MTYKLTLSQREYRSQPILSFAYLINWVVEQGKLDSHNSTIKEFNVLDCVYMPFGQGAEMIFADQESMLKFQLKYL